MRASFYPTKDGRFDQWQVPVAPWEIAYARRPEAHGLMTRPETVTRWNIALGKVCGSYDPAPALRWREEQERAAIAITLGRPSLAGAMGSLAAKGGRG